MTQKVSRRLTAAFLFIPLASFAWGVNPAPAHPSGQAAAAQSTEDTTTPAQSDRTAWRSLHRKMSKDDVRKLLGEPRRVSVSRFYEAWDYPRGTVIFDGKGRLDSWSEL
jgi:outer membrane protein assembly factor BamE (lipoprotein component of BamABCDE complex)